MKLKLLLTGSLVAIVAMGLLVSNITELSHLIPTKKALKNTAFGS